MLHSWRLLQSTSTFVLIIFGASEESYLGHSQDRLLHQVYTPKSVVIVVVVVVVVAHLSWQFFLHL